jgi:hypothetical protein
MNLRLSFLRALAPACAAIVAATFLAGAAKPADTPLPQEEALRARILEIVKEESAKAFERHGGGVLTADQITTAIVPMIADEATRRAVPSSSSANSPRRARRTSPSGRSTGSRSGWPTCASNSKLPAARRACSIRETRRLPRREPRPEAAPPRPRRREAHRPPDVKRQLTVAFENLLVEHFLKRVSEDCLRPHRHPLHRGGDPRLPE